MPQPLTEPAADGLAARRLPVKRLCLLLVVLVVAMATVYFSPIKDWLKDSEQIRNGLESLGVWAWPIGMLAVALLVACGVPRLLLCAVGGMVLGFWGGLLLSQAGTMLGYYAIFLFVRWGGRSFVLHRWPALRGFAAKIESQGTMGVIIARQLPIHGTLTNLCLGLTDLRHRQFLLGTVIGLIPEAVPVALVGAGLVKGSIKDSAGYLSMAAVAFVLLIWVGGRYMKRLKAERGNAQAAATAGNQ